MIRERTPPAGCEEEAANRGKDRPQFERLIKRVEGVRQPFAACVADHQHHQPQPSPRPREIGTDWRIRPARNWRRRAAGQRLLFPRLWPSSAAKLLPGHSRAVSGAMCRRCASAASTAACRPGAGAGEIAPGPQTDETRNQVLAELEPQRWTPRDMIDVIVRNGVVELLGDKSWTHASEMLHAPQPRPCPASRRSKAISSGSSRCPE